MFHVTFPYGEACDSEQYSIVYSNLNESDPWIYKKGKTMFHMTFPYGETCDSEQYSIRSEIQAESILWGEKKRNCKDVVRLEKAQGHRSRGVPRPHPHADWDVAQNGSGGFYGAPERKERPDAVRKASGTEMQIPK